jgi:PLP dependent protein
MIAEKLHEVESEIERSRQNRVRANKNAPVDLVAVTKNHDVNAMREAIDAGVTIVGENRIQEAMKKHELLDRKVSWHLIGHLQTNKVNQAVQLFDLIHSVDSDHLMTALDRAAKKIHKVQDILLQVNLAREDSKFGIYREDLPLLMQKVDAMDHLHLCGLMCIAPNYEQVEDCRPLFREMYEIFQRVQEMPLLTSNIKYLSMGMTHDYTIAIEEGANMVRVGTAIFGARQY